MIINPDIKIYCVNEIPSIIRAYILKMYTLECRNKILPGLKLSHQLLDLYGNVKLLLRLILSFKLSITTSIGERLISMITKEMQIDCHTKNEIVNKNIV